MDIQYSKQFILSLCARKKLKEKMSLDVKKNRYDGTVGSIPLGFNPVIRCFSQVEDTPKK